MSPRRKKETRKTTCNPGSSFKRFALLGIRMQVHNVTKGAEEFTCNAYLALGETPTLVDAGQMAGVVDVIGEHTERLDRVVLTHQHGDHVGQLDAVIDAFDADCYAYDDHPRRTHELAGGDELLVGSESVEVVYTPGHADDHVSLVSDRSLFSGDVVVYNDGAFDDGSFGRTDYPGLSRERLIESIKRLRDRLPESVEHMYAGHGDPYTGDIHSVVKRALRRAKRREPKYPDG
jgi:glyoxylase-like metal-dependent hydrolase (beta-lactamase superfamily II)